MISRLGRGHPYRHSLDFRSHKINVQCRRSESRLTILRQALAIHHARSALTFRGAISHYIQMIHISAHGTQAGNASVSNFQFARPMPLANEVVIDILFCGICHSDVELLRNNWGMTKYPCVPGHEATGRVTSTGSDVAQTHVGDYVGVGCMIDSCRQCVPCKDGWENHCEGPNGPTMTYNGYLMPSSEEAHNFNTFGAWANRIVVREEFIVPIPKGMDLARTAPLMCPGTATFGPLTRFCIKGGDKIGIVGLGGPGE